MIHRLIFAGLVAALSMTAMVRPVWAVNPDEMLDDPALEERARGLSAGLRCLVCQNQSIDDSDAPLARDLRLLVRERLVAGDSDEEILDFVVSRYGEFVLLSPRMTPKTWILWLAPGILLVVGAIIVVAVFRRVRQSAEKPLDAEEERRLAAALKEAPDR